MLICGPSSNENVKINNNYNNNNGYSISQE